MKAGASLSDLNTALIHVPLPLNLNWYGLYEIRKHSLQWVLFNKYFGHYWQHIRMSNMLYFTTWQWDIYPFFSIWLEDVRRRHFGSGLNADSSLRQIVREEIVFSKEKGTSGLVHFIFKMIEKYKIAIKLSLMYRQYGFSQEKSTKHKKNVWKRAIS